MSNIIRNILFAAVVAGATSACVKTDGEVVDTSSLYYHAADNTLTIGGDETETTLHVEADCSWQIATVADWLQVSPQSGSGNMDLQVIADGPNPSWTAQREAELVLTAQDGIVKRIAVVQGPSTRRVLEVRPGTMSFEAVSGAPLALSVACGSVWTVEEKPDWIILSSISGEGDAQLSVSCEDNTQMAERMGKLVIVAYSGELRAEVSVTQEAATLPVLAAPVAQMVEESRAAFSCAVTESMFHVTECGVCVGTSPTPSVDGQKWKSDNLTMAYDMTVTGLDKKTVYYVCAYAVSPVGTAFSEVVTFTTLSMPKEGDNNKPDY